MKNDHGEIANVLKITKTTRPHSSFLKSIVSLLNYCPVVINIYYLAYIMTVLTIRRFIHPMCYLVTASKARNCLYFWMYEDGLDNFVGQVTSRDKCVINIS